jgi:hypothetical protein
LCSRHTRAPKTLFTLRCADPRWSISNLRSIMLDRGWFSPRTQIDSCKFLFVQTQTARSMISKMSSISEKKKCFHCLYVDETHLTWSTICASLQTSTTESWPARSGIFSNKPITQNPPLQKPRDPGPRPGRKAQRSSGLETDGPKRIQLCWVRLVKVLSRP